MASAVFGHLSMVWFSKQNSARSFFLKGNTLTTKNFYHIFKTYQNIYPGKTSGNIPVLSIRSIVFRRFRRFFADDFGVSFDRSNEILQEASGYTWKGWMAIATPINVLFYHGPLRIRHRTWEWRSPSTAFTRL